MLFLLVAEVKLGQAVPLLGGCFSKYRQKPRFFWRQENVSFRAVLSAGVSQHQPKAFSVLCSSAQGTGSRKILLFILPAVFLFPLSPYLSVIHYRSLMILQRTTCTWVCDVHYQNCLGLDTVMQVAGLGVSTERKLVPTSADLSFLKS